MSVPGAYVLYLRWTCQRCGWSTVVAAPGFAGDGRMHYPDGVHACGPVTAQREPEPVCSAAEHLAHLA
jgi:hypothetical protein